MPTPAIRPYHPGDRDAVFDICLRTAEAGGDARHIYRDQDLLPNIFAAPYAALEPDLAFVLDSGAGPVGYVLGTSDTPRFVRDFREKWLPVVAARRPRGDQEPRTRPRFPLVVLRQISVRTVGRWRTRLHGRSATALRGFLRPWPTSPPRWSSACVPGPGPASLHRLTAAPPAGTADTPPPRSLLRPASGTSGAFGAFGTADPLTRINSWISQRHTVGKG